jgi:large subunit ribosomal protein L22
MAKKEKKKTTTVQAVQRFIRLSPFKARKVADIVRGKRVEDALAILKFMPQKAAFVFEKIIKSAVANSEHRENPLDQDDLLIEAILVDEGPTMHRIDFRAQGRVYRIRKRTSHIKVVLNDKSNIKTARSGKAA